MLADMDSLERRMAALVKKTRGGDADAKRDLALMEKLLPQLADGVPVRRADGLATDEIKRLPQLQLLTSKPVLYVCNVA
jgi:ribosome-binding ATPase YchF (GTP1/OBG family)